MQLTKDDLIDLGKTKKRLVINYTKYQQVVKFYDDHKDKPELFSKEVNHCFMDDKQGWYLFKQSIENNEFNDWLFSYCFKDGLK